MKIILNEIEIRILGSLMEKEVTTPEYYPLSLNALVNACNQKSSRDPVMDLAEKDVAMILGSLKDKHLVWQLTSAGSRVPKYEHNVRSVFSINQAESAVLCVLFLRGFQTIGEIRARAERLFSFTSIDNVQAVLKNLVDYSGGPLVKELPRLAGRKENRFAHCFSGEPIVTESELLISNTSNNVVSKAIFSDDESSIVRLEMKVDTIKSELEQLKQEFAEFRKQLE